jgi:phospholipid/cholesterol/gamma-HCH transport system substrate-binding protein
MKNTLETRLGLFFALAIVVAAILLHTIGAFDFFSRHVVITASFKTAQELKKGDLVKTAGVEIGRVEDIQLLDGRAVVTMKIKTKYPVKTDSKAFIKFTGLMGQNFVSIEGGTPGAVNIQTGSIESGEQPDLGSLMAKMQDVATGVENLTKSFSTDNLSKLLGPLTDFIEKNSPPLTATIANMRLVSDNLVSGRGTVGRLLSDESLYTAAYATVTNLQYATSDIKSLATKADNMIGQTDAMITQIRNLVDQINKGQGTLGKFVKDEALYNETALAMTNLREILQKMNRGDGTVGKLINDDSFLKNAKLSLQKLDRATDGLEDQGPLSVLGLVIGSLF